MVFNRKVLNIMSFSFQENECSICNEKDIGIQCIACTSGFICHNCDEEQYHENCPLCKSSFVLNHHNYYAITEYWEMMKSIRKGMEEEDMRCVNRFLLYPKVCKRIYNSNE